MATSQIYPINQTNWRAVPTSWATTMTKVPAGRRAGQYLYTPTDYAWTDQPAQYGRLTDNWGRQIPNVGWVYGEPGAHAIMNPYLEGYNTVAPLTMETNPSAYYYDPQRGVYVQKATGSLGNWWEAGGWTPESLQATAASPLGDPYAGGTNWYDQTRPWSSMTKLQNVTPRGDVYLGYSRNTDVDSFLRYLQGLQVPMGLTEAQRQAALGVPAVSALGNQVMTGVNTLLGDWPEGWTNDEFQQIRDKYQQAVDLAKKWAVPGQRTTAEQMQYERDWADLQAWSPYKYPWVTTDFTEPGSDWTKGEAVNLAQDMWKRSLPVLQGLWGPTTATGGGPQTTQSLNTIQSSTPGRTMWSRPAPGTRLAAATGWYYSPYGGR